MQDDKQGVPVRYIGLVGSFLGLILQSVAMMQILAFAVRHANDADRSLHPIPHELIWLLGFGGLLMALGIGVFAKGKGYSLFWGLLALFMCPGWLLGVVLFLVLPDKTKK